jgi:cysteine desulfurase
MNNIYLDYAATTPVDPEVADKIKPFFDYKIDDFGNPSSLHYFGQRAKRALDFAREKIAKTITANHREIVFTSSATEANNLILRGILKSFFKKQKGCGKIPKFIISSIEHPSVLETVKTLENDGAVEVVYLPVNSTGIVDLSVLEKELDDRTLLVSVMWVNNEIGTVQPIEKLSTLLEIFKKENSNKLTAPYPLFHTDAVQAFNLFDLSTLKSGADLMTLSSHKIYGPKGAGLLYIKGGADVTNFIEPIITGGGQEYGLRSGTENVPAVVGFACAAEKSYKSHKKEHERLEKLSRIFFDVLKKEIPEIELNNSWNNRAPHILNIYFPHHENLGIALDLIGISASAGSACAQRHERPSYVLEQMGLGVDRIKQSIRFSFGRFTSEKDINEACRRIIMSLNK